MVAGNTLLGLHPAAAGPPNWLVRVSLARLGNQRESTRSRSQRVPRFGCVHRLFCPSPPARPGTSAKRRRVPLVETAALDRSPHSAHPGSRGAFPHPRAQWRVCEPSVDSTRVAKHGPCAPRRADEGTEDLTERQPRAAIVGALVLATASVQPQFNGNQEGPTPSRPKPQPELPPQR